MCQVCILRRSAISKKQTRSQLSHVTYVVTICGHSTHQLRSSSYTKYVIREIFWFIIPYSQLNFTLDAGLRKNWNWKPLLCVMFLKQTGKKIKEISGVTNQAWLLQFMWNWVWIRVFFVNKRCYKMQSALHDVVVSCDAIYGMMLEWWYISLKLFYFEFNYILLDKW